MVEIHEYVPAQLTPEPRVPDVHSEWKGLEQVVPDVLDRFNVGRHTAIDFGVWYGFSTGALANLFDHVYGVDHFKGDDHAGRPSDLFEQARRALTPWHNIVLVSQSWQEYTATHPLVYADLVHIDIVHTYDETFACGVWACRHADLVLFHDTDEFPDVRAAVSNLALAFDREFWNYPRHHGLGVLVRKGGKQ